MSQLWKLLLPAALNKSQPTTQPWKPVRAKQSKTVTPRSAKLWLSTLLCSLSVSGCGLLSPATPPHVSQPIQLPSPPALTQPIPSQKYSSSAQSDMQTWREKLMGTSSTSKP